MGTLFIATPRQLIYLLHILYIVYSDNLAISNQRSSISSLSLFRQLRWPFRFYVQLYPNHGYTHTFALDIHLAHEHMHSSFYSIKIHSIQLIHSFFARLSLFVRAFNSNSLTAHRFYFNSISFQFHQFQHNKFLFFSNHLLNMLIIPN